MLHDLREAVAHAIQEECSGSTWPAGSTSYAAAERGHWFACADAAIRVFRAALCEHPDDQQIDTTRLGSPQRQTLCNACGWTRKEPRA